LRRYLSAGDFVPLHWEIERCWLQHFPLLQKHTFFQAASGSYKIGKEETVSFEEKRDSKLVGIGANINDFNKQRSSLTVKPEVSLKARSRPEMGTRAKQRTATSQLKDGGKKACNYKLMKHNSLDFEE
jgi:hypothetical protein